MGEAVDLMNMVNRAVRAGDSGTAVSDAINSLCSHLKVFGQQMELTDKGALDSVFVSLRQAACRDAGQLGKAVRLRLMQLIELRAMKWRPSLSHSSYYSTHSSDVPLSVPSSSSLPSPPFQGVVSMESLSHLPSLPVLSSPLLRSPLLPPPDVPIPIPSPTFYLLPALANMGLLPFLPPPPHLDPRLLQLKKPAKPVLREEIVIRNADSGKLMGVKGRRVALVEQISGSVISFQKVTDPKSKQRTLTITASDQESIERAKILIEETITRNASPATEERAPLQDPVYSREEMVSLSSVSLPFTMKEDITIVAPEILR